MAALSSPILSRLRRAFLLESVLLCGFCLSASCVAEEPPKLVWKRLPDFPAELGVAGPLVGVHNDALLVAGGANFPVPVWENDKVWRDRIHVLQRKNGRYEWSSGGALKQPLAYAACVSTDTGVVCMGGNDAKAASSDVFALVWDPKLQIVSRVDYPPLPEPCAFGQAVVVGGVIYLAGGQSGADLETASKNFWTLDLAEQDDANEFHWRAMRPWPGKSRSLNVTAAQFNGKETCVYVMSGRRQQGDKVEFLRDVWEYSPSTKVWRERARAPRSFMAGIAAGVGTRKIFILGGADGKYFGQAEKLKDRHPGFPKEALVFDTVANRWTAAGKLPANHVTTVAARLGGANHCRQRRDTTSCPHQSGLESQPVVRPMSADMRGDSLTPS